MSYQSDYALILNDLINNPDKITDTRVGKARSNFCDTMRVNLDIEFPHMEIKKVSFKNVLVELLWFIRGETDIKYLVDNGCNIWNDDAYRYYKEKFPNFAFIDDKEFILYVKSNIQYKGLNNYQFGDMGKIYGYNWRSYAGSVDQLQNCINTLNTNPDDRRMIVTSTNPEDIQNNEVGLPACHNYFQFYTSPYSIEERINLAFHMMTPEQSSKFLEKIKNNTEIKTVNVKFDTDNLEKYNYPIRYVQKVETPKVKRDYHEILDDAGVPRRSISLFYNMRSNDFFLGQPYNMSSYSILLNIVGNIVNMKPKYVVYNGVDNHLYEEHLDAATEFMTRYTKMEGDTFCKSKLKIKRRLNSIDDLNIDDFELIDYNPQKSIKAPLLT
jgi:thymidylate synthase